MQLNPRHHPPPLEAWEVEPASASPAPKIVQEGRCIQSVPTKCRHPNSYVMKFILRHTPACEDREKARHERHTEELRNAIEPWISSIPGGLGSWCRHQPVLHPKSCRRADAYKVCPPSCSSSHHPNSIRHSNLCKWVPTKLHRQLGNQTYR